MPEKKFNWGTLILGIIIGAVIVGIIWAATKPAVTEGGQSPKCQIAIDNLRACVLSGMCESEIGVKPPSYVTAVIEACGPGQQ